MGRPKRVSDEAILQAARELFAKKGFGASTREIARRAGISEAVLFQRHRTKLDLFFAAMVPPPFDPARPPENSPAVSDLGTELEAIAVEIMGYFRSSMPVLIQLMTHPSFNLERLAARASGLPLHRLSQVVLGCLEAHRQRGSIPGGTLETETAAMTLLATLHSLALFERMGIHGGTIPDQAVKNIVRLLVAGLKSTKEDSS